MKLETRHLAPLSALNHPRALRPRKAVLLRSCTKGVEIVSFPAMTTVLVCTQDPVLAKRVRFLLGRNECRVQIFDSAEALEAAEPDGDVDLLVLSQQLGDREAQEVLDGLSVSAPTMVLGASPNAVSPELHVVEDPNNAQAISAMAQRLLGSALPEPVSSPSTPPPGAIDDFAEDVAVDPGRMTKAIHRAWDDRADGLLIVERSDETWTLEFESGRPVRMRTSIPGDRFGRHLVDTGRLDENAYAKATMNAMEDGIDLGAALVQTGAMTQAQLEEERSDYARLQLVDRFEADLATFRFERGPSSGRREFTMEPLPVLAEGFKRHARPELVASIVTDNEERYFKTRTEPMDIGETFVLEPREVTFLEHGGRAYNVADAAEIADMSLEDALKLLALLWTCEAIEDFTPGIAEFEARIREERQRTKDIEARASQLPSPEEDEPFEGMRSAPAFEAPAPLSAEDEAEEPPMELLDEVADVSAPPRSSSLLQPAPSPSMPPPPPPVSEEVPIMPVVPQGQPSRPAEPMVFAAPTPRGPDGQLIETPERGRSKEAFQRGVQLLGQGHFESAEDAFREAITLCSEEHVYMVGLARSIFYNPDYSAEEKIPLLRSIVRRAESIAPNDQRVLALRAWVEHNDHGIPA